MPENPDAFAFSADVADWPAERAAREYPADHIAREAYRRGLAEGLSIATP